MSASLVGSEMCIRDSAELPKAERIVNYHEVFNFAVKNFVELQAAQAMTCLLYTSDAADDM
eukprot:12238473-Alexandrium_andersonii.AAC.1